MILTARLGASLFSGQSSRVWVFEADMTLWAWRGGRGRWEVTSFSGGLADVKHVMKAAFNKRALFLFYAVRFSSVREHLSVSISMWCEQPRVSSTNRPGEPVPRKP